MKKHCGKRLVALVLALVLCLGLAAPAGAVSASDETGVQIERIDNSAVTASAESQGTELLRESETPAYADTDSVRVSIVLEGASTLEKGYSTQGISSNAGAMAYRSVLRSKQEAMAKTISKEVLNGAKLDVVWNLTLAANLISANVPYGKIEAIRALDGIVDVVIENRYQPDVYTVEEDDPNMSTSSSMIGSTTAYLDGYYGAGSRIAIIDTGIDTDHQSFDAGAFDYALTQDAEAAGKAVADYNLLTKKEIGDKLSLLNIAQNQGVSADSLYGTTKLPFGYNYVDESFDLTHDNDTASEHGSHVAGIAAANRYIPDGDDYASALDTVKVQGVAPDAQILTMKVLGQSGGAYESDYMAAIEDAIVLDADTINLSLGSANPGLSFNKTYQAILDELANSDTVVTISSGNNGYWAENAATGGYLYADDVSFQTGGSPGTYTNALTVASADNVGLTGVFLRVDGNKIAYNESEYTNVSILTMDKSEDGTGTEYDYIYTTGNGTADQLKALTDAGVDLTGKVVFVTRGSTSFADKHMAVSNAGGAACIVVNNVAGELGLNLTGSTATIPCVSVNLANGTLIREESQAVTDDDGTVLYYTGKITVSAAVDSTTTTPSHYTMSSFSSWGVPGSLELKPEITAPGGNIYSVNGQVQGGKAYENMSGTSMAAPQVTGMAALAAQYIREKGLDKSTGLSPRKLAQSLLMSTAVPVKDEEGKYNPVLQQGAGLANIGAVVEANSYILMDADVNAGAADGKVKAELGDDPAKTGIYTFGFTIYNLTDAKAKYNLSGDVFTQGLFEEDGESYLDTETAALAGAKVTFSSDSVELAAKGSAHVDVTIDVTGCDALKNYPVGAYLEAYVYVVEETADGALGTSHSIPVLGFYGSWTDASMFEVGTYAERYMGLETRTPYTSNDSSNVLGYTYPNEVYQRVFTQNRYDNENNPTEEYIEDRNSLNNTTGEKLIGYGYAAIRNAGDAVVQVTDANTGKVYVRRDMGSVYSAFYYANEDSWQYTSDIAWFQWAGADQSGNALPEGTKVNYSLILIPEYYADENGEYDVDALTDGDLSNGELGQGAYLTTSLTIDNTAPEILSAAVEGSALTVTAKDSRYVACLAAFSSDGAALLKKVCPNQQEAGTEISVDFDLTSSYGKSIIVAAFDYAGNMSTYRITLPEAFNGGNVGTFMGATADSEWYSIKNGTAEKYDNARTNYYGAAYVGGVVYLSNANGLSVADMDDLTNPKLVAGYDDYIVTNLAYDSSAEKLYGLALNATTGAAYLTELDLGSGAMTNLGLLDLNTNTLATDSKGNFYAMAEGGDLYTFTLDTLENPTLVGSTGYPYNYIQGLTYNNNDGKLYWSQYYVGENAVKCDVNGDRKTNEADAQLILDYAAGKLGPDEMANYNFKKADINGDGKINTFDAYLLLNLNQRKSTIAYLLEVSTQDGSTQIVTKLPTETAALFAPDDTNLPAALAVDSVTAVALSQTTLSMTPSVSAQLTAFAAPWTLPDLSVTWSSSNEAVATVDETGLVTAHAAGSAEITATSVADPTVSASCAVEVTTVDVTLTGALQDGERKSRLFTWNLGRDETWTGGAALENSVESVVLDTDRNVLWQVDAYDFDMHKVDPATGETLGDFDGIAIPYVDLGYSELFSKLEGKPQVYSAYQYYLYLKQDPTALTSDYMNMVFYLMFYAQAGEFVAVSSGVPGTVVDDDGVEREAEIVYLVDNVGNVWSLGFYESDAGVSASIGFTGSDSLTNLAYPGEGPNKNCSLVVADNGDLFFSYYNGENNVLYRLRYNEDEGIYNATLIGDFGQGVRPAALISAVYNDSTETTAAPVVNAANALVTGTVAEINAKSEGFVPQDVDTMTGFSPVQPEADGTDAGVLSVEPGQGSINTVTLDLTAQNSTNGKLRVSYDKNVLTLTSVEAADAALNSYVTEDGSLVFAYASKEAVTGTLATLTFTYDRDTCPKTTDVDFKTLEEGGSVLDKSEGTTLTLKDEVEKPTEPTEPTEPTDEDCPSKAFTDLSTTAWYHKYVDYVLRNDIMVGNGNGTFGPNDKVTRAQMVTLLYGLAGRPGVDTSKALPFTDVNQKGWYANALRWAYANGIAAGTSATTFSPNASVTREQMVSFLARYAKLMDKYEAMDENLSVFTDIKDLSSYAEESMKWAVGTGLVSGTGSGKLDPKATATRAQIAVIVTKYSQNLG